MQNIALNVGPIHVADGGQGQQGLRSGRELDLIVSENRGRYAEKTSRGGKFCAPWNAVTVAATHNSPLTAGTGTPIVGIYNPIGSGFNLEIVKLSQHLISGTPAGPLIWNNIPLPQNIQHAHQPPAQRVPRLGGQALGQHRRDRLQHRHPAVRCRWLRRRGRWRWPLHAGRGVCR